MGETVSRETNPLLLIAVPGSGDMGAPPPHEKEPVGRADLSSRGGAGKGWGWVLLEVPMVGRWGPGPPAPQR